MDCQGTQEKAEGRPGGPGRGQRVMGTLPCHIRGYKAGYKAIKTEGGGPRKGTPGCYRTYFLQGEFTCKKGASKGL